MPEPEPGMYTPSDDSLVFAEESKWSQPPEILLPPTQPGTSPLFGTYSNELDDVFGSPRKPLKSESPVRQPLVDVQTQVIGDTQVIGYGNRDYADTQVIPANDTQIITSFRDIRHDETLEVPLASLHDFPTDNTADIQIDSTKTTGDITVSDGHTKSTGDEENAPDTRNMLPAHLSPDDDTQVIPQPEKPLHFLKDSLSQVWGNTQPITQVLPTEKSSPDALDYADTTLVLSPLGHDMEPTTQVVNTQEELIEHDIRPVDLACKPIFSSSQRDNEKVDMSIISNDEEGIDEKHVLEYDDSVFRQRLKRRRLSGSHSALLSENSESEEPTASYEELVKVDIGPEGVLAIVRKSQWSQSSSELEDISHDVNHLELDMFQDGDNEDSVHVIAPKKRRRNLFSGSQGEESEEVILGRTQVDGLNIPQDEKLHFDSTQTSYENAPKQELVDKPLDLYYQENLKEETLNILTQSAIKNSAAVWALALFKYFPAQVLQSGELRSTVEFSNGATMEINNTDLFVLDIRIGDEVQAVQKPGIFVVTGLSKDTPSNITCLRGYSLVTLSRKALNRNRKPMEISVPLSTCFMEIAEWSSHQLRFLLICNDVDLVQESYNNIRGLLHRVESRDESALSLSSPQKPNGESRSLSSSLFEGMFFFVTSIEGERKDELQELIISNGGALIDDEIKQRVVRGAGPEGLCLSLEELHKYRFGALLADGHSRSAKYLQALALGWPILSDRFVDSVIADPSMLVNWSVFLLPSGLSLYTGLKSMDMYMFKSNVEKGVKMDVQLANNTHLLAGYSILVLNRNQDAKTLDMCGFIFHAFGALSVTLLNTVNAIDKYLQGQSLITLVYDNGASNFLKTHSRKKSTRISTKLEGPKIGVVDWEWVVQCVISGYIWQPSAYVDAT